MVAFDCGCNVTLEAEHLDPVAGQSLCGTRRCVSCRHQRRSGRQCSSGCEITGAGLSVPVVAGGVAVGVGGYLVYRNKPKCEPRLGFDPLNPLLDSPSILLGLFFLSLLSLGKCRRW